MEGTGKALDAIGKVAKPVAIATDVARLGNAVVDDGGTFGENTIKTSASVAGGWGGALAGAAIGGKLGTIGGASVGVWFGGVGAVPGGATGGFVGSIIGGIAGSFGGSWLAEKAAETVIEKTKE